ncbi:TraR/DksA family transcriptional regulator [Porphyromonas uenonis]|uniref:TraR/DksA family transcriptional regulator n=1 Tax=Porphyromonas uenonis TaxID=281920 RepID=UPI00046FE405|nr:TraR/DksA C4-type zinc finger protein [Porphyromonas uenonis]
MEDSSKKRYNPEELEEFRILIEKKIAQAREDLNMLRADNVNDISDTTPTYKDLDEGSITQTRLENDAQAQRLQDFIEKLEAALLRIQNGTYGICSVTGKLIPKERLRAVPHTTKSIEAKLNRDKLSKVIPLPI